MTKPLINENSRVINVFSQAYDEYCTPYHRTEFSDGVRHASAMNRSLKLQACKAIFIGDVSVGKTTIVSRFCHNKFREAYKATIGVDFEVETFLVLGQPFNLQIWDTAGQERFKCIAQAYYRNANIIVIVFDMTKIETLQAAPTWLQSALAVNSINKPLIFLVGSKAELLTSEELMLVEMLAYDVARQICAEYWTVSARNSLNIVEFFQRIVSLSFHAMIQQNFGDTNLFAKDNESVKIGFFEELSNSFDCNGSHRVKKKSKCFC